LDPAYTHTAIAAVGDILHFKGLVNGTVQENWVEVTAVVDQGTHWEYTGTVSARVCLTPSLSERRLRIMELAGKGLSDSLRRTRISRGWR